jgi:hypothetical protein
MTTEISLVKTSLINFNISLPLGLNTMVFEVMKPQIAIGLRGVAAAYGEVLLKVWKDAPAEEDEVDAIVSIQVIIMKSMIN